MAKNPTAWVSNPNAQANLRVFDSGSVTFDSSTIQFDGQVAGQSFYTTKNSTPWISGTKNATAWVYNPLFLSQTDAYDTAIGTYDGTNDPTNLNYDAVVAGISPITTKKATTWVNT